MPPVFACPVSALQATPWWTGYAAAGWRSARPVIADERAPGRPWVIGEYHGKQRWNNPIRMIRTHAWKYNLYRHWGEELYDLRRDPGELHNLASSPRFREEKEVMRRRLAAWMDETGDRFLSYGVTDREGRTH